MFFSIIEKFADIILDCFMRELKRLFSVGFLLSFHLVFAQSSDTAVSNLWKTQLPTIVANHPLGTFLTQAQTNFTPKTNRSSFQFEYQAGNIWLPKVTAYIPTNIADEQEAGQYPWHFRDPKSMTAPDSMLFQADGVLRAYNIGYNWSINKYHSIQLTTKLYSLDGGKFPFSTLSGDEAIEWFHSNVAGGEDPFARKEYELNEALIDYQDENGQTLRLNNGDFGLSGFVINYNYAAFSDYLAQYNSELVAKIVTGINTNKYNSSMDLGLGISGTRIFQLNVNNLFRAGLSYEAIKHNLIASSNQVTLIDQNFLKQYALFLGWERSLKHDQSFSISGLYQHQSSYRKSDPTDYYALEGAKDVSHWHYAITHFYELSDRVSLIFAYQIRKITFGFYVNEDIVSVNNAPDIQTGFSIQYRP